MTEPVKKYVNYEPPLAAKQSRPSDSKEESIFYKFRNGDGPTWWKVFFAIIILTAATRFYKLDEPDHVCWDETHFGKFAGLYINRTFFFDVHPPLGKMLIGLFGYLDGYNATFSFEKPGIKYEDHPYMGMRIGCALMGAMLVPLSFLTVWEMTFSLPAATYAGILILLDHGMITLNRFILLDPPLLFFISAAIYSTVKFNNQRAFSLSWWFWLSNVGVMLAGAIGVKFVGLFVVVVVGIRTISDLWDILGDLSQPVMYTVKHFMARALCLIVLPSIVYMGIFYVHFHVLNRTGSGDGLFSSAFQISLEGNSLNGANSPSEVAYGAAISIRSTVAGSGYLHSHQHNYPEGEEYAAQQQITTYSMKDENNLWFIKSYKGRRPLWNDTQPITLVRNGDFVRLDHLETARNLHSHRKPSPITKSHLQVTAYGENGRGDINDVWEIVIRGGKVNETLQPIRHQFQLIHYQLDCALANNKKKLPKWGFEQNEVTCNPNKHDSTSWWQVEENLYPRLPNVSLSEYKLGFLGRFIESHLVQFAGNSDLKPKEGEHTSRPWMWPINLQGQYFSGDGPRIYMLGNPIIWWGNLLFMAVYLVLFFVFPARNLRGIVSSAKQQVLQRRTLHACGWLQIGWLIHYVPFWGMGRILYFHHYFPALLFASMLSGVIIDYLMETLSDSLSKHSERIYYLMFVIFTAATIYSFYLFAPLSYGFYDYSQHANSTMHGLKWLPTWQF